MPMTRQRKIAWFIAGLVLASLLVVAVAIVFLAVSLGSSGPSIRDKSVLVLRVEGAMPDYQQEDSFLSRILKHEDKSLSALTWQLKKAKTDRRIGAVLLEIDLSEAGWAKAEELRDAITDFRSSGKPIYAYMEFGLNIDYFIATACDKIYEPPIGDLFIYGLSADVMFFRGSLDKLGIYADVYKIGDYKNAPDEFTRKTMSDAQREVVNSMLDDEYNRFIEAIVATRHKTPDEVRGFVDNAPLNAKQALDAGLIDEVKYRDDIDNDLTKRLGYNPNVKLSLVRNSEYARITPESLGLNQGEKVAVVYASGDIASGKSSGGGLGGPVTVGSDTLVKALNNARDDAGVRAIVLRVDSPGGTSYASDVIWRAVVSAKTKKPVVVSMSDLAASGGYYISCGANRIVAQPSTITGSIGVFAGKPVLKGFYDWVGITNEYLGRGKNSGLFREDQPFNKDERAKFEAMINSFYWDNFIPKVAQGRKRDPQYINSIGQGHVWMGDQALANGLVDEFGGLDRALEVAKELANIPAGKPVRQVIFPAPQPLWQAWFGDDQSAKAAQPAEAVLKDILPEDMRRAAEYASILGAMKRGEIMAMMPFDIRIK